MNQKRLLLYLALAFIIFTLWSDWFREHPTTTSEPQTVATHVPEKAITKNAAIGSPATTDTVAAATNATQSAVNPSNRYVEVKTDVLDVKIDTVGGNIIYTGLNQYPKEIKSKEPTVLLSDSPDNYYVSQTGITGPQGPDTQQNLAQYQTKQTQYELQPQQNEIDVPLVWQKDGITITKTFKFKRNDYAVLVNYFVKNASGQPWTGNIYSQIRKKNQDHHTFLQFSTFSGAAISSAEKPYQKISFSKMDSENLNQLIRGGWLAMQQRYFLSAWIPNQQQNNRYYSNVDANKIYTIGYLSPQITVQPQGQFNTTTTFYAGPELEDSLKPLAPHLDLTIDFGWLWWLSVPMLWLLQRIYNIVGNWGWAIVIITILIKAIFYKLSEMSYRSMAKMRQLQPKMEELKRRFGEDKQRLHQATMELYKKEKVNPLGGCLPMLIQIPVFIALYYVLIESVQLRQAPFIFWIHDLSAKDPYFILPVLMGISMWVQQKLTPTSTDPSQEAMMKMMQIMPILFTIFFLSFPSGLVLYWLTNNILSILQQWYIMRSMEKKPMKKKVSIK